MPPDHQRETESRDRECECEVTQRHHGRNSGALCPGKTSQSQGERIGRRRRNSSKGRKMTSMRQQSKLQATSHTYTCMGGPNRHRDSLATEGKEHEGERTLRKIPAGCRLSRLFGTDGSKSRNC